MNKFQEYNKNIQDRINAFPIAYAFSQKQLEEAMKKLGVNSRDDLVSTGYGGYIRESDVKKWTEMVTEIKLEKKKLMNDDDFVYHMFFNTMSNHEYIFTLDDDEILAACELTADNIYRNDRLNSIFIEAKQDYLASFNY